MRVVSVRFTLRKSIGQYQHEELDCTLEPSEDKSETADELMVEARRVCVQHSTEYLAKMRGGDIKK